MRRWLARLLAGIAVVALLLLAATLLVTNSNWGRERVRRYVLGLIQRNSHGIVHIGGVTGNLLSGFTLHDVVITDSARAPFIKADEIWARYSLGTLRGKKIEFSEVRLVKPVIVLDEQPGGKWNYDRIFPRDTTTPSGPKKTGWGTWIRFSDVTMLDGDLTVRSPWRPDPNITPAETNDAVRRAFGPEGRLALVKVPNGYQKVSSFHRINGLFPLVRLEDPGYKNRLIDVAALKMIAEPFRPPVADVRGLTGTFEFTGDSVWWKGARASFPATRVSGDGRYYLSNGDLHLRLHGDPVNPADIRWAMTRLPEQAFWQARLRSRLDRKKECLPRQEHGPHSRPLTRHRSDRSGRDGYARVSECGSALHFSRHATPDPALPGDEIPATADSHGPGEVRRRRALAQHQRQRHCG